MTRRPDARGRRSVVLARRLVTVGVIGLMVLHVTPPAGDPQWMLLGFLPWDLAYPLLWMVLATALVVYMTGPAWPDEPIPARHDDAPPEGTASSAVSPPHPESDR